MNYVARYVLFCSCLWGATRLGWVAAQPIAQDLNETVITLPVTVKNLYRRSVTGNVTVTQFKPTGAGPFPIVIINHGRNGENRAMPPRFRYTSIAGLSCSCRPASATARLASIPILRIAAAATRRVMGRWPKPR